jgi:hypothetical protein
MKALTVKPEGILTIREHAGKQARQGAYRAGHRRGG